MPVQINEMIIRANIVEGSEKETEVKTSGTNDVNKDEIIKECIELMMEIINNKNER